MPAALPWGTQRDIENKGKIPTRVTVLAFHLLPTRPRLSLTEEGGRSRRVED